MSYKDGATAYKIKSMIWRITDKKYLTGINKEGKNHVPFSRLGELSTK